MLNGKTSRLQFFNACKDFGIPAKFIKQHCRQYKDETIARKLLAGFSALTAIEITYAEHPKHYQAVIENARCADKLQTGFAALEATSITIEEHPEYYLTVIENGYCADKLQYVFEALRAARITLAEHPEHYLAVIENGYCADELQNVFEALKAARITLAEHPEHYLAVIKNRYYADDFSTGFEALKATGITIEEHPEHYLAVIEEAQYIDALVIGFSTLAAAGITFEKHPELFQEVIKKSWCANKLQSEFATIAAADVTFAEHPGLYLAIIKQDRYADRLPLAIAELHKARIHLKGNEHFYITLIESEIDPAKLSKIFSLLDKLGVNFKNNSYFFNANLLIKHYDITSHALSELINLGIPYKSHGPFWNILLEKLSQNEVCYQNIINIVKSTSDYVKSHSEEIISSDTLISMVQQEILRWEHLTYGPLRKLDSTATIEALLETISDNSTDLSCCFRFEEPNNYFLTLPNQAEVNLSLLIKNANLSHLTLRNALIITLGKKLKSIIPFDQYRGNNFFIKLLAAEQQTAFELYVGNDNYININRLFRSEALASEPERNFFAVNDSKNIAAFFIIGCLLNDAVNKLDWLPYTVYEKQLQPLNKLVHALARTNEEIKISHIINDVTLFAHFLDNGVTDNIINALDRAMLMDKRENLAFLFPDETTKLDRGEILKPEDIEKRLANPWRLPTTTSFSASKDGAPYFHNPDTIRTTLEGSPNPWIVYNEESEVILAHGGQMITTRGSQGLMSRFVRTPSLEGKDHYWSDTALQYAFMNYLNKPYTLHDFSQEINGIAVARPNHGLAHTYRVMLYLENIIHYFAHYAQDPEFKHFCQLLSDSELEWLRVAAAFSITGRENEMRASENLDLYDTFRQASSDHFAAFVNETRTDALQEMKERMQHIVRYMGNPHYECATDKAPINNHPDDEERKQRNFYHRLLTIAHKMDLVRCYTPEEYDKAMLEPCKDLSELSDDQKQGLEEMVRYAIALNKKHGNALKCDILPNGTLTNVDLSYTDTFGEISQFWKRLEDVTQMVTQPKKNPFTSTPIMTPMLDMNTENHKHHQDDDAKDSPAKKRRIR